MPNKRPRTRSGTATNVAIRYQRARTMFDLNLSAPAPFLGRTSVFVSGRNIFIAPAIISDLDAGDPMFGEQREEGGLAAALGLADAVDLFVDLRDDAGRGGGDLL